MIIGASGRARHGKTETCEAIRDAALADGLNAKIYDIGQLIRAEAIEMGLLPADLKREDMKPEHLDVLIHVGKLRREQHKNYWVREVLWQANNDMPDVAICPNIRLPIEADAFRQAGGYIIRNKRLNADGSTYISPDRPPNDITETALEFWPADFYLTTINGHLPLLRIQAAAIYKYLLENNYKEML